MSLLITGLYGEAPEPAPTVVDWATGDIDTIKTMLANAKAGTLDISTVWAIGQGRVVNYTNTSTTGSANSEWVLTDFAHSTSGGTAYTAWIHTKALLSTSQKMNSSDTNAGGWNQCACRKNVMPNIYNAIPSDFRSMLINAAHIASAGSQSTSNQTDTYYLTLHSEKEVQGDKYYATNNENNACRHLVYFQTASNKVKTGNGGSYSGYWWLRSPRATDSRNFCYVYTDGSADYRSPSSALGLAVAAII